MASIFFISFSQFIFGIFFVHGEWFFHRFMARLSNDHILFGSIASGRWCGLNSTNHIHSIQHFAEYHMSKIVKNDFKIFVYELIKPSIKPGSFFACDEELTAIGVFARICHAQLKIENFLIAFLR